MIRIERLNDDFHFRASNDHGNIMDMDNSGDETPLGIGPMDSLLAALGGCSGIDIVIILKKMKQQIDSFKMEIDGKRVKGDDHSHWESMNVHYIFEGDLDPAKVKRSIDLSLEKYCSVAKTLEKVSEITYTFSINGTTHSSNP